MGEYLCVLENGKYTWDKNYPVLMKSSSIAHNRSMIDWSKSVILGDAGLVDGTNIGGGNKDRDLDDFTLSLTKVEIKRNSLTYILGTNGSGKSSLIYALIDEMDGRAQYKYLTENRHLVTQNPWIMSTNILENIVFSDN